MVERKFMQGNHALAEAAIRAGCRFYAGYPIKPASEIHEYMTVHMPAAGGFAMAGATEMESIVMAAGAAASGVPAMAASSSTGISLMQEQIAEATNAAIPVVVVNTCRGALQGDYHQSVKGGGHGDYRTIVLAPATISEMVEQTFLSFDLAWKYRHPVLLLADSHLVLASQTVDLPYRSVDVGAVEKWAAMGGRPGQPRNTITHQGEDPETGRVEGTFMRDYLISRMETLKATERRHEAYKCEDADVVIVAYGTAATQSRMAVDALRALGVRAGLFRPVTLWPYPDIELRELAGRAQQMVVVELNLGQMVEDVRAIVGGLAPVHSIAGIPDQESGAGRIWSVGEVVQRVQGLLRVGSKKESEVALA